MAVVGTRSQIKNQSKSPSLSQPPVPTPPTASLPDLAYSLFAETSMSNQKNEGLALSRHVRASSDPVSRGGAFSADGSTGFDHEPNPFEQSFSGPRPTSNVHAHDDVKPRVSGPSVSAAGSMYTAPRRARSNSPVSTPRLTPGGLHKLPPLSLLGTPGVAGDLSSFGWGVDSLKSGPLSPSLLSGPQNPFDNATLRTGLTPFAPGQNGVSFPPPSPATAALFAMMTNNTPGTSDAALAASGMAGGGPRPHEGSNEGNHFEASFAQAAPAAGTASGIDKMRRASMTDDMRPASVPAVPMQHYQQAHVQGPPVPMNQAHRSQLAAQLGNQMPRSIAPQVMHPSHLQNQIHPGYGREYLEQQQQQQQQLLHQQQQQHQQGNTQNQHQGYGNQNPLYLLSQAQDLSNHNDDAVVAAAALSNLGGPFGAMDSMQGVAPNGLSGIMPGQVQQQAHYNVGKSASPVSSNGKGAKKPAAVAPPAAAANKRKKGQAVEEEKKQPAPKKGRRGKAAPKEEEEDDDDDEQMMEGSMSPVAHNPNETEEEKRRNFLERNRQAALKCRQRKKAWLQNLQSKVELLTTDNDTLQSTVTNLKDEVASLRAILAAHSNCPIASTNVDRRQQGYANGGRY